jgi:hypothetical protein
MAVFLSASDETTGGNIFHYAGYLAPVTCWVDYLAPVWNKYVLDGPPRISEFHIVDLRSKSWREKHGITETDAIARIDAAVDLISSTPGVFAIRSTIDNGHFEEQASGLRFRLNDPRRAPTSYVVDYPAFEGYVHQVLSVCAAYEKTEKVDFLIEKKREVFPAIKEFFEALKGDYNKSDMPRFAEIMGELIPADKKSIPLQAADLLCWHTQRYAASSVSPSITFSDADHQRLSKLTRLGSSQTWPRELIEELCGGLKDDWRKLNESQ